jgi:hypothetical protein
VAAPLSNDRQSDSIDDDWWRRMVACDAGGEASREGEEEVVSEDK